MQERDPIEVGAPQLIAAPPAAGTAAGRFHTWLGHRDGFASDMLGRLTRRWNPLGSFIEVHFDHPNYGPSGAVVSLNRAPHVPDRPARIRRLLVIPFSELEPFVEPWKRGETVLVHLDDMPDPLRLRYAATPVRWSLNVPLFAEETWVGTIGAVSGEHGFEKEAVASYESSAAVLGLEYAADDAWRSFREAAAAPSLVYIWTS